MKVGEIPAPSGGRPDHKQAVADDLRLSGGVSVRVSAEELGYFHGVPSVWVELAATLPPTKLTTSRSKLCVWRRSHRRCTCHGLLPGRWGCSGRWFLVSTLNFGFALGGFAPPGVGPAVLDDLGQFGVILRVEDVTVAEAAAPSQQGFLDINQQVGNCCGETGLRYEYLPSCPGLSAGPGRRCL